MTMSISQSAPASAPASPGASAAGRTEGGAFGQTLVQLVAGTPGAAHAGAQASPKSDPAGQTATNALAQLLAGGAAVSSTDLLKAIEELLQKLDTMKETDDGQPETEKKLSDALAGMDDLLSLLGFAPMAQLPLPESPNTAGLGDGSVMPQGSATQDAANADAVAALLQTVRLERQIIGSTGEAQNASNAGMAAAETKPSAIALLKSDLQAALAELKPYIKENKTGAVGRNAFPVIGKQLAAVAGLLDGSTDGNQSVLGGAGARTAVMEAVQSMLAARNAPAASVHLQKLSHQLLNAGLLGVVPTEEKPAEDSQPADLDPTNIAAPVQALAGNPDAQRAPAVMKAALPQPVPVQQFAQTMQGMIVKQFSVGGANGVQEAKISLFPEQLGHVDVHISLQNGLLTAQFVTDTAAARDMLEHQLAQLRAALQTQGLQVDKLEVSQSQVQPNLFQERQGQQGRDQQSSKRNRSKDESVLDVAGFDSDLEQMQAEQAVHRDLGLGRGIHTTA